MLDQSKHKQVMTKILLDLMSEKKIAALLGFKGGTALYLFYGLDRFSTDLDFDLIGVGSEAEIELINAILLNHLDDIDQKVKRFTWYWMGSYQKGEHKIKFEVNTRQYPNEYEQKDFRGYSIRVMKPAYMAAHKLCAVLDRPHLQNRDLYDTWWLLKNEFPIKAEIVKLRMGKSLQEYWGDLLKTVTEIPANYDILSGLGEIMDSPKKDWVKAKLLKELRLELASRA
jgi:predicted nucleotidyltransferase component of viral defense system